MKSPRLSAAVGSLTLAVALCCATFPAHSVDLGDLNPTDPAKGTIDDAEAAAHRLMDQAQQIGNGWLSNSASQLDAIAQSATLLLGHDIDKNVGDLSTSEQQALVAMRAFETSLNGNIQHVYNIKDTSVIDLTAWESHIPFVHPPMFFIQSIRNTSFERAAGDYNLTLAAYGLGDSTDSKATISASLDGNPLTFDSVDQARQSGMATLAIPNSSLTPYFKKDLLTVVPLTLHVTISRPRFLHHFWHSQSFDFPVYLTLYPAQVAKITVHVTTPAYQWVDVGTQISAPYTTPDKDGCDGNPSCRANNGPVDVRVPGPLYGDPVPGTRRIASAHMQCNSGSICDFNGCTDITIDQNATHASATWCTWSHPTQWQLVANVQEWRKVGTKVQDLSAPVLVDHPAIISLPSDYSLITMDVAALGQFSYTFVVPGNDPHGVLLADLNGPQKGTLVVTAAPLATP